MAVHHVFLIPGLDDKPYFFEWALRTLYKKYEIIPHIKPFGFRNTASTFEKQLTAYMDYIRPILKDKNIVVSLIGVSAGASASINVWQRFKKEGFAINGSIINVCGRLSDGKDKNVIPTLAFSTRKSKIFYESVIHAEKYVKELTNNEKLQITTFRALFDEVVPSSTIPVKGANNIRVPMLGHIFTIVTTILFYSKDIINL